MAANLPAKGFFTSTSTYQTNHWTALDLPEHVEYKSLFEPSFWRHHAHKFSIGDIIRVRRVDGVWDVQLVVDANGVGALTVSEWPKWPKDEEVEAAREAASAPLEIRLLDGKPVPRVEHTPATKWRVIGVNGEEVTRNFATKPEAERDLERYVASIGKTLAA